MPEGKENGDFAGSRACRIGPDKDKAANCDSETDFDIKEPVLDFNKINSSGETPTLFERETPGLMLGNGASNADKDEAVNCDSEGGPDNGPHPRWVPSAQANGPRWSDISCVEDVYPHPRFIHSVYVYIVHVPIHTFSLDLFQVPTVP